MKFFDIIFWYFVVLVGGIIVSRCLIGRPWQGSKTDFEDELLRIVEEFSRRLK
jgi:hypothetical protein